MLMFFNVLPIFYDTTDIPGKVPIVVVMLHQTEPAMVVETGRSTRVLEYPGLSGSISQPQGIGISSPMWTTIRVTSRGRLPSSTLRGRSTITKMVDIISMVNS